MDNPETCTKSLCFNWWNGFLWAITLSPPPHENIISSNLLKIVLILLTGWPLIWLTIAYAFVPPVSALSNVNGVPTVYPTPGWTILILSIDPDNILSGKAILLIDLYGWTT